MARWKVVSLWLVLAGVSLQAVAEERLPDRRATGGATRGTQDATQRQNIIDLLQQIEALQAEVRQLRNTTEVQSHEIEQLKSRQRSLYDDLDRRLREAERRGAASPSAGSLAVPAEAPAPATVSTGSTVLSASKPATTPAQQQEYDAAFALLKQGLYDKGVKAFRKFLAKYPDSGLSDNAQYWIAEGNYVMRNYKLALEEFTKVLAFSHSAKVPDAMLKIGYSHYELGAYDKARKVLSEVQEKYSGMPVAKLAHDRLEKMKKEGH